MSPLPGTAQIAGGPDPEQCPLPIHAALWQRPENNQGRTSRGTQRVCTGRGHECAVTGRHLTVCAGIGSCGERGEDVELVSDMDKGKCDIRVGSTVLGDPQEGGHKGLLHHTPSSSQ